MALWLLRNATNGELPRDALEFVVCAPTADEARDLLCAKLSKWNVGIALLMGDECQSTCEELDAHGPTRVVAMDIAPMLRRRLQ